MLLSNFRTRLSKFARNCPISVAIDQFRTLSSDFKPYFLLFLAILLDIIYWFNFEHYCPISDITIRFWTLLSVFVHHRATFDAMSSDFGHCIPILSIISLFRHFCPILDIMFWFRTLFLVLGHNVPKFGHYWLITNSIVRIRAPLSELRYCCTNLNTIARFRSLMSVFKYRCPILDTIVRIWTLSYDFGHHYPVSDTIVWLWTL